MTWSEFCKELILLPPTSESSFSAELELGIQHGLPTGKFRVSFGEKEKAVDDVDYIAKVSTLWTEHDVARQMVRLDAALLIDDFERAQPALLSRIADLAKILTQSFASRRAKLLIVGTGDVYRRLVSQNKALKDRIEEVSLGTLSNRGDSWRFLELGFEKLRLRHPGTSRYQAQQSQLQACVTEAYLAANGLPKALNHLGQSIAIAAKRRSGISAADVINGSKHMLEKRWEECQYEFPQLLALLRNDHAAMEVIKCLYTRGIGSIHRSSVIHQEVDRSLSSEMIEQALDELARIGFIVRTGVSGGIVFVEDPGFAHTLGVVLSSPDRFPAAARILESSKQLSLAFPPPLPPLLPATRSAGSVTDRVNP